MMTNNKYHINKNKLILDNSEIVFDFPIDYCVEISGMLIVLLSIPVKTKYNENVFGVSLSEKKIKWQIAKKRFKLEEFDDYKNTHCKYTGISVYGGRLRLNNWCDTYLIVDPSTGQILEEAETR